jgi:protein O-mannosyl-transferase
MYERSGNAGEAALYRDKAERLFPGVERRMARRTVELYREGDGYLSRQLYAPAENVFCQALMIKLDYLPALIGMGRLSAMRGELANAVRYFTQTLALDPLNAPAHYNLSLVYEKLGLVGEARQEMVRYRQAGSVVKQREDGEHR